MLRTIRQLRDERGWSRLKLANELGVTPGAVYNWETGTSEPSASKLRQVAQLFDVSMDDIELVERKSLAVA